MNKEESHDEIQEGLGQSGFGLMNGTVSDVTPTASVMVQNQKSEKKAESEKRPKSKRKSNRLVESQRSRQSKQ